MDAATRATLTRLAKQCESNARQYERRNASINHSACHDGKRQLNVGLAVANRLHAEALRKLLADSEPHALPASIPPPAEPEPASLERFEGYD